MNAQTRIQNPEVRSQKTLRAGLFVVRVGEIAVLFYIKPADEEGRPAPKLVYELVPDDEATTFAVPADAFAMAVKHGMKCYQFKLSELKG